MRRALIAVLFLLALPAIAQDRTNRISVFVTDPSFGFSGGGGSDWGGGVGVAYEKRLGLRWTAELAVSREEYTESSIFSTFEFDVVSYPIDLTARYHFGDSYLRWRPYVGGGAHYVSGPDTPRGPLDDRFSAVVIGGLDFNMTEKWSLRADAKHLVINDASEPYDETLRIAVGLGFRF
jgi:Outer membrane protein beta-barrel domain